jgi:hypothetical protein
MAQIQSIQIWNNGEQKSASILNANIVQDNLETDCSFYYQLCESEEGKVLAQGNLTLGGEDYLAWDGSNDTAYIYIADKLNLTII